MDLQVTTTDQWSSKLSMFLTQHYYMAGYVSGQDGAILPLESTLAISRKQTKKTTMLTSSWTTHYKINSFGHIINLLLTKVARSRLQDIGLILFCIFLDRDAILTSRLVNNAYTPLPNKCTEYVSIALKLTIVWRKIPTLIITVIITIKILFIRKQISKETWSNAQKNNLKVIVRTLIAILFHVILNTRN